MRFARTIWRGEAIRDSEGRTIAIAMRDLVPGEQFELQGQFNWPGGHIECSLEVWPKDVFMPADGSHLTPRFPGEDLDKRHTMTVPEDGAVYDPHVHYIVKSPVPLYPDEQFVWRSSLGFWVSTIQPYPVGSIDIKQEASGHVIPEADSLEATLATRGDTHGEYLDHARYTQAIKSIHRSSPNWEKLHDHEKETLDMIAHKTGRILAGDPHFPDHWLDMSGYSKLSHDRLVDP